MPYGMVKSWVMLAWLAGLVAVLLVDAVRKLIGEDHTTALSKTQQAQRVVAAQKTESIHDLFDKSADDPLPPEPKPGLALRDRLAVQQEYKKSA